MDHNQLVRAMLMAILGAVISNIPDVEVLDAAADCMTFLSKENAELTNLENMDGKFN